MRKILVLSNPQDWSFDIPDVEVVAAKTYLKDPNYTELKNVRVFNLCRQFRYQSIGYYVSLLAEARGQKVIPSVTTLQDFKAQTIVRTLSDDLDQQIQKSLRQIKSHQFTLSIYFGQNLAQGHAQLSKQLYNIFQAPLLRAQFRWQKKWILQSVVPISLRDIPENHRSFAQEAAKAYLSQKRYSAKRVSKTHYDLAILFNPFEKAPPSNPKALQKFQDAAEDLGFYVEMISKEDYGRVAEFDGLFIRETTSVNHHTYKFARQALAEGLVVIDDPISIMRCANKVYLAEILNKAKIGAPKTMIIHRDNAENVGANLGFPCVLKRPDGAFSMGVVKVESPEELAKELDKMLKQSDLIIGQGYAPTEFDWRIGILDGKPLYACKYFMAKGHWQIYNWNGKKSETSGDSITLPIYSVDPKVVETARRAAALIGNGFYGVDLKEMNGSIQVIEVNDNPSIDTGCEDLVLGDSIYRTVMELFKTRIELTKVKSWRPD